MGVPSLALVGAIPLATATTAARWRQAGRQKVSAIAYSGVNRFEVTRYWSDPHLDFGWQGECLAHLLDLQLEVAPQGGFVSSSHRHVSWTGSEGG